MKQIVFTFLIRHSFCIFYLTFKPVKLYIRCVQILRKKNYIYKTTKCFTKQEKRFLKEDYINGIAIDEKPANRTHEDKGKMTKNKKAIKLDKNKRNE